MGVFETKKKTSSVFIAKDRLKVLLVSDRVNCTPDTFENIAAEILVQVPCNCCDIFTVKNNSENPVVFNNPSLTIERLA